MDAGFAAAENKKKIMEVVDNLNDDELCKIGKMLEE